MGSETIRIFVTVILVVCAIEEVSSSCYRRCHKDYPLTCTEPGYECIKTADRGYKCMPPEPKTDCLDVLTQNPDSESGVYTITTWESKTELDVYCDMEADGGGWTVFQHRKDGSLAFDQDFKSYEEGFGAVASEHWLGLQYIQEMTSQRRSQLRFTLTDVNNDVKYRVYDDFSLSDGQKYRLQIGTGSGSPLSYQAGSLLAFHKGRAFTTYDVDNGGNNCGVKGEGGWWYKNCYNVHFNGAYGNPGSSGVNSNRFYGGIVHYGLVSNWKAFKSSTMMFR